MKHVIIIASAVALAACGGGGSSKSKALPDINEARGVYQGATDTGRALLAVVRDSGESYVFLGEKGGGYDAVEGLVHGMASVSGDRFLATSARRFYLDGDGAPVVDVTVEAVYSSGQYLTGEVVNDEGDSMSFTSSYHGDAVADLSALTGVYVGSVDTVSDSQFTTILIDPDGTLTGKVSADEACPFSGHVVPHKQGTSFNVSVSFANPYCLYDGQTLKGILYHEHAENAIYMAVLKKDRTAGVFFYGGQPN